MNCAAAPRGRLGDANHCGDDHPLNGLKFYQSCEWITVNYEGKGKILLRTPWAG